MFIKVFVIEGASDKWILPVTSKLLSATNTRRFYSASSLPYAVALHPHFSLCNVKKFLNTFGPPSFIQSTFPRIPFFYTLHLLFLSVLCVPPVVIPFHSFCIFIRSTLSIIEAVITLISYTEGAVMASSIQSIVGKIPGFFFPRVSCPRAPQPILNPSLHPTSYPDAEMVKPRYSHSLVFCSRLIYSTCY